MTLGHVSDVQDSHAMDIDEADGFGGPSSLGAFSSSSYSGSTIVPRVVDATINISLSTLSVLPVLQSSSGEPTRDKSLVELILNCDGEDLLILGPALLRNMQQRTLNFSPLNFGELLEKLGDMLKEYQWSRSERLMTFIINLLHSSMHIWLPKGVAESDVGDHVRTLCHWLVDVLSKYEGGAKSWSCRDSLVRFLHKYLERDPSEEVWTDFGQSDVEASPISLLPNFAQDEDVRVRFRAAIANAHTLSPALLLGRDPSERYLRMRESLSVEVDE